jgi:hypothetical protein
MHLGWIWSLNFEMKNFYSNDNEYKMLFYRYYTDNKRICAVAEDVLEVDA